MLMNNVIQMKENNQNKKGNKVIIFNQNNCYIIMKKMITNEIYNFNIYLYNKLYKNIPYKLEYITIRIY